MDIGLLSADIKHQKDVSKEEVTDGLKRPVKKYLLQPSIKIFLLLLLIALPVGILIGWNTDTKNDKTEEEMQEIMQSIDDWKRAHNYYPESIEKLTTGRPLRNDWLLDQWNRRYVYKVDTIKQTYLLISAGHDGIFGTSDDITKE